MAAGLNYDVLISGLGPTGAALTALLARRGVSVLAIDKETAVYPLPRAVHFDHEIMRLLQKLGLANQMLQHAREVPAYEFRAADGQVLMRMPPAPSTASSWASGYMFHQPGLESALRDQISTLPHAEMRLGWTLERVEQQAADVTATVSTPDGERKVHAQYLVGCDGAWSPVRESIGGSFFDYGFDEPWVVVDVAVPPGARVPDVNLQICDPARPTTCVLGGPGRHRWEFMLLPGESPETMAEDEQIQKLLEPWQCGPIQIERKAVYRFHGLVANRWRAGRVLIAGDAAHQTPPFAGQGMCAGLRDAANLSWKLASVVAAGADPSLLDTYQEEREPHVRAVIELAIFMGRLVCTLDPDAVAARDGQMLAARAAGAEPPAPPPAPPFLKGCVLPDAAAAGTVFPQMVQGDGVQRLRMDDQLGEGPWLFTRAADPSGSRGVEVVSLQDNALAPFRAQLQDWLDQHDAEAVLVRPDRYVFGAGKADVLLASWAEVVRPMRAAA